MRIALVAMLALVLAACGSKTEDGAAAKREASAAARALSDDEVAAVLESSGTPLAKVRFVLDSRPLAGKPFNLKLIVSTTAPVPRLGVSIESGGLVVDPASATLALVESGGGTEIRTSHDFSVTARQDGITELSVHLTTDADTPETLYVIPVLVAKPAPAGAGAPASDKPSDKPDPAATGNNGQPKKG